MVTTEKQQFLESIQTSLADATFVKLSLGKCRGREGLEKVLVSRVLIQGSPKLRLVYRFRNRDTTENFDETAGLGKIGELLGSELLSGNLFTTQRDVCLLYNKRGETRITQGAPTFTETLPTTHNRQKNVLVSPTANYLERLEVTKSGVVKGSMSAKYKQIYRFVEILDSLIRECDLQLRKDVTVVDIGSGKGYLTFALYDHLVQQLKKQATITGIEIRPDLVKLCNRVAEQCGFTRLRFEEGTANETSIVPVDVVIALHACNTATDDAIYRGIKANASLIVCAPCCQHELANQLSGSGNEHIGIVRFGLLKQRQAELVTDAARALLLESAGYHVKIIEFISTEHTSKNLMITGTRSSSVDRRIGLAQYQNLKRAFGFQHHALESLLGNSAPS